MFLENPMKFCASSHAWPMKGKKFFQSTNSWENSCMFMRKLKDMAGHNIIFVY